MGAEHLRESARSKTAKLLLSGAPIPSDLRLSSELEFTISSLGILALLSHWSASEKRMKRNKQIGGTSASFALLTVFLDRFLGMQRIAWATEAYGTVIVKRSIIAIAAMNASQAQDGVLAKSLICKGLGASCHIAACVVHLLKESRNSKRTANFRSRCGTAFVSILARLSQAIEASIHHAFWNEHDHLFLGVLKSPQKTGRPRRVSGAFKRQLTDEAISLSAIRRPGQLLAGMASAAKRRKGEEGHAVGASAGSPFEVFNAYQYWLCMRETFSLSKNFSITMDGTRVSGKEPWGGDLWYV